MKQGQDRSNHDRTRDHTDDFRNLLPFWGRTQHVAGFQVLHHVAGNRSAGCDDGGDEQGGVHQVRHGQVEEQVADHPDQTHREQQRGNGHARNRGIRGTHHAGDVTRNGCEEERHKGKEECSCDGQHQRTGGPPVKQKRQQDQDTAHSKHAAHGQVLLRSRQLARITIGSDQRF